MLTAALVLVPGAAYIAISAAPALASTEVLVSEPFTGTTTSSPDWVLPGAPGGPNSACMTAGTATTPVPACSPAPDSPGNGALELTSYADDEEGGVAYSLSVPTVDGIDATFDTYQYDNPTVSSDADGIGFFLAAADPADPTAPAAIGSPGGDLGYSGVGQAELPGMTYGYLGIGLDVFGNYANTTYEGTGCTDPGWDSGTEFPDNVSVRGPGNDVTGYCMLNSTAAAGGLSGTLDGGNGSRSASTVPVEVVINPSASAVTTPSGLAVPAGYYAVAFTPIGASKQTLSGSLPSASGLGFPSGWLNASGIPYQVTFGWVGSTGSDVELHDITSVSIATASGIPPTLSTSVTDNASGAPPSGSTMAYHVSVSNGTGTSTDPGPIDIADTVPSGETPTSSGLGGSGWSCSIAGEQVSCDNTGTLAAGASLPVLDIPVTVTASPGTQLTNSVTASSDDSDPATGQDAVTVGKISTSFTASANPTSTSYGNTVALSESGLPAATSGGSVTFSAGGSTLCTATIQSAGSASCTTAALAPNTYSVTATYGGNATYVGSTASTSFTISTAATSFSASANPTSTTYGNAVALHATGLPSSATGTVTFTSGGSTLCSGSPSSGSMSCNTSASLAPATYPVTATYSGDSNYSGSTASTSFTISKILTSFTGSANPTTNSYGNTVTLSESGLPAATSGGSVTFSAGGSTLCTATIQSGGSASCPTAVLAANTYSVTATYGGTADYAGSTAPTSFVITTISTSFTASATPPTAVLGGAVTLVASGLPGAATGSVTFSSGGSTLCSASLSSGSATCTTSTSLSVGTYPVTVGYPGDAHYAASSAQTSFTMSVVPQLLATALAASASPSPTPAGSSVTLSATGLPVTATGTVTFTARGSTLCAAKVGGGLAFCSSPAGLVGTYGVVATYSGDSVYAGSSTETSFVVTAAGTAPRIVASATPARSSSSTSVMLEASALPAGASGTVTFSWRGTVLCTAAVNGTTASCRPTSSLPAGTYSVTVTYEGSSTTTDFAVLAGYWLAGSDGGVFAFSTSFDLSTQSHGFAAKVEGRVVGMAPTPDDAGYWLVTSRGQVIPFGDARYHGDVFTMGKAGHLAGAIVGIAGTADGGGYWLTGAGGVVLPFGDAHPYGDTYTDGVAGHLAGAIVAIVATGDGRGYWLVGSDGKVLPFGDAHSYGDTYSAHKAGHLAGPIVGMTATADGRGYWLAGAEGGVFSFGDAHFMGNLYTTGAAGRRPGPVVGMAATPDGRGYWLATKDGEVLPYGDARKYGDIYTVHDNGRLVGPIVGIVGLARNS
jgi:hypothetical protein